MDAKRRSTGKHVVAGLALCVVCLVAPSAAAGATYHVAPGGSDSNPGTSERPWRTLDKPIAAARPGDKVYLHPGTYGARGTITTASLSGTADARITFRGLSAARKPVILGHFKVTGSYLRFARMTFAGPTGKVKPVTRDNPRGEQVQVWVDSSHVTIARSVIRDSDWYAGIFLDDAEDTRIVGNCITGNGDEQLRELMWNKAHGIYWHSGSGVIANNLIAGNLARGVQLYQEPHDVLITQNTIVRNGRAGVMFAEQTRDSLAVNNVVARNDDTGIRGLDVSGTGNVVMNNLGYKNENGNFGIGFGEQRMTFRQNKVGNPAFLSPGTGDYRLGAQSPALDEGVARYSRATDQEGIRRPQGGAPDYGAYERPARAAGASPVCRS